MGYRGIAMEAVFEETQHWLAFSYDWKLIVTRPWTLITCLFVHAGFSHLFWNMLTLYWFGKIFSEFTKNKLAFLYFSGGIFGILISYVSLLIFPDLYNRPPEFGIGASGSVLAIIAATAALVPNYQMNLLFIGPVRLKYIALVMILLDLLGLTYMENTGGHFAHLGGAAFGLLYISLLKSGVRFPKIFKRKKLKVVHTRKPAGRLSKAETQRRIDEILDKINRSGYDSLSKEEKEDWFKLSNKI